ncbi:MAG: nitric oxide reductase activation protein [Magnetococcales bacterium]|nr:nitric oxide reductase activation protein [Magnetococcales bacterium]
MSIPLEDPPLPLDFLEERLEALLEAALSSRRTCSGPVHQLARCCRADQEQILAWVEMLARTNPELAFQFAQHAPDATQWLDMTGMRQWLGVAFDRYDQEGLHAALRVVKDPQSFAQQRAPEPGSLFLATIVHCLEKVLTGLGGRPLKIEIGEQIYTDTETLFLPSRLARFPDLRQNERLYRCVAAGLWAQTRYGTFFPELSQRLSAFPDPERAGALYYTLENHRLAALLRRRFPGLGRDIGALTRTPPWPASWQEASRALEEASATPETSWRWLEWGHAASEWPETPWHQGVLMMQRVDCAMQQRLQKQRHLFRRMVGKMLDKHPARITMPGLSDPSLLTFEPKPDGLTFDFNLDGQPLTPPESLEHLVRDIVQDLGQIPPEYLEAAGPGGYDLDADSSNTELEVWQGVYHEEGAFLYDEWDCHRQDYRKGWCVLRELPVTPSDEPFVQETLTRYAGLVRHIRRSFEMLRGGEQRLKKQDRGDEVDWDALVEALVEARSGGEMSNRLFQRIERQQRDVATLILVDMSGSTKGWVNDAIRASVVLLSTALEVLQDRYAIYGFSGMTRKRCEFMRIKPFTDAYSVDVERRIANIRPMEYTRMGVFIRHAIHLLETVEARIRLLIILSDGKPEDYDGYRGEYSLEDTRKALIEARQRDIHPFCITIDQEAQAYLPRLYGPSRFVVLPSVDLLPLKISEIYRKITT